MDISKIADRLETLFAAGLVATLLVYTFELRLLSGVFFGATCATFYIMVLVNTEKYNYEKSELEKVKEKLKLEEKERRVFNKKPIPLNGEIKIFYQNGQVASRTTYKDDSVIAPIINYSENGQPLNGQHKIGNSVAIYKDGVKNGPELVYNDDGSINCERHWKNGKKTGVPIDYYNKKLGLNLKRDFPNGVHRCGYINGNPASLHEISKTENLYI